MTTSRKRSLTALVGGALIGLVATAGNAGAATSTPAPTFSQGRCPSNGGNGVESGPWTTPGATLQFGSYWLAQYRIGPKAPIPLVSLCNAAYEEVDKLTAGRPYNRHLNPIPNVTLMTSGKGGTTTSTFHCVWFKAHSGICRLYSVQVGKKKPTIVPAQTAGWEGFAWNPWLRA